MRKTILQKQDLTNSVSSYLLQIGLAFSALLFIGANDGAMGVLIPSISAHYHIGQATAGQLFLFTAIGYLITTFNNGLLIEKLGSRFFLLLGITACFASTLLLSLVPPFPGMLLLVLLLGAGVAILDAGLNSYIAGLPRNTALLNYLHAFYGAGALLGPLIASTILATGLGWNMVYVVLTAMCLVLLIGFGLTFRRWNIVAQHEGEKTKGNIFLLTVRMRIVWIAAIFLLFYVGTEVSLGGWSYTFLTVARHGPPLIMGWIISGYWAGLTLGRLTLAQVAQRVGEQRLIRACLFGVIIGLLVIWLIPVGVGAAIGLCFTGFCLGPIFPTTIGLMSKRISARLLPSAIGFLASLGSMGAAIFSWGAGNLTQDLGLWTLLPYEIILTIMMMFLWLALRVRSQAEK